MRGLDVSACIVFQHQRSQTSVPISAGVDPDTIVLLIDIRKDGVAMNDHVRMTIGMLQETFANPQLVAPLLFFQRHTWMDSGMDKYVIARLNVFLKATKESPVGLGDVALHQDLQFVQRAIEVGLAIDAVTEDCLAPAMLEEMAQHTCVLEGLEEHFLVIAGQDADRALFLPFACTGNNTSAVRPAINQIAQKNDAGIGLRQLRVIMLHCVNQCIEQVQSAMDVANDIQTLARWHRSAGLRFLRFEELSDRFEHGDTISLVALAHKGTFDAPQRMTRCLTGCWLVQKQHTAACEMKMRAISLVQCSNVLQDYCVFARVRTANDVASRCAGGTKQHTQTRKFGMLTSIRGLLAASIFTTSALCAVPAFAQEAEEASDSSITVSANVALTSEYRFRGVDLSGGDIAVQGGVDVAHDSGFYIGTWGSSLDEDTVGYGAVELDVYGGWSGDIAEGLSADVGVIGYLYPNAGAGDFDYVEFYSSLGFTFGPAEATVGLAYAPKQDSLGGTDNIYVYTDLGVGIPGTPVTVTGHLGYTDGFLTFTNDSKAFDWSIGAETSIYGPLSLGVAYVGAEGDIPPGFYDFTDDSIVVTLSASF